MYSIGEVSKKFNLPQSTLRFYDKEGLLRSVKRESGVRKFDDAAMETLFMIECLKKAGMEIKDIKIFLDWVAEGNSTLEKRLEMFKAQRKKVEKEIEEQKKVLDLLKYKCWYYETAVKAGTDLVVKGLSPDDMPDDIRALYLSSHEM